MAAALHAFARDGYAGAKTDEIAAKADVSKGLIFHYYHSKQQLYVQTVQLTMTRITQFVMPEFQTAPTNLVSMVVAGTKYKTAFGADHPDEMHLMITAFGETSRLPAKVQQQLTDLYTDAMQTTRAVIGTVLDQMTLASGIDRELAIDLVVGIYNQLFTDFQTHMKNQPDIQSMADVQWLVERAKGYMNILENGLVAKN